MGLTIREQSAPGTPASGALALYAKQVGTMGVPYAKNDDGTELAMYNTVPIAYFISGPTVSVAAPKFIAPVGLLIVSFWAGLSAGTATVGLKKNNGTISSTQSTTTTIAQKTGLSITMAAGDYLQVECTAVSSAANLSLTIGAYAT